MFLQRASCELQNPNNIGLCCEATQHRYPCLLRACDCYGSWRSLLWGTAYRSCTRQISPCPSGTLSRDPEDHSLAPLSVPGHPLSAPLHIQPSWLTHARAGTPTRRPSPFPGSPGRVRSRCWQSAGFPLAAGSSVSSLPRSASGARAGSGGLQQHRGRTPARPAAPGLPLGLPNACCYSAFPRECCCQKLCCYVEQDLRPNSCSRGSALMERTVWILCSGLTIIS